MPPALPDPALRIPNLGSHILALVRRQLPADWSARHKTTPVVIETSVETSRYTGAVYRASGSGALPAQGHRPVLAVDNGSVRLARSHVHTGLPERLPERLSARAPERL